MTSQERQLCSGNESYRNSVRERQLWSGNDGFVTWRSPSYAEEGGGGEGISWQSKFHHLYLHKNPLQYTPTLKFSLCASLNIKLSCTFFYSVDTFYKTAIKGTHTSETTLAQKIVLTPLNNEFKLKI